jgi:hypothetical protein
VNVSEMTDVSRHPRLTLVFGSEDAAAATVAAWMAQGCAIESRLVHGTRQHSFYTKEQTR